MLHHGIGYMSQVRTVFVDVAGEWSEGISLGETTMFYIVMANCHLSDPSQ